MLGDTLDWPWFTDDHRRYATKLVRWAEQNLTHLPHDDVDQACRARVRLLGEAGFLKAAVPKPYDWHHLLTVADALLKEGRGLR